MRIGLLPALGLVAAGCTPQSPFEWPLAALRVIDATMPDGACTVGDPLSGPAVSAASRGRCLVLDASGSTSPSNENLVFSFSMIDPGGDRLSLVETAGAPFVVLDPAIRQSLAIGVATTFEVVVYERSGRRDAATTFFIPLNTPPVAVAPAPRTLPAGGFPWAPGAPFDVAFDGSRSFDPDGDPLLYCWTLPGVPEQCGTDPTVSVQLTPDDGRVSARLRVDDGDEISASAHALVTIGPPNLWSVSPGRVERLDSLREGLGVGFAGPVAFLDAGADSVVTWANAETPVSDLFIGRWPTGAPAGASSAGAGGTLTRLVADPEAGRVWGLDVQGAEMRVVVWEIDPLTPAILPASSTLLSMPAPGVEGRQELLEIDSSGNAWIATLGGDRITMVDPSLQMTDLFVDGTVAGLAARPGSDEVWAIDEIGFLPLLRRFMPGGEVGDAVALDVVGPGAFAWSDASTLWLAHPDAGLLLLDAAALEAGLPYEATIRTIPVTGIGGSTRTWQTDPPSGGLWLDRSGVTLFATPDGDLIEVDHGEADLLPHAVDAHGALWYSWRTGGTAGIERGRMPRRTILNTLFTSVDPWFGANASPDLSTGGVWIASPDPPRLMQFAEDGTVVALHSTFLLLTGELLPPAPLGSLSVSPDGVSAWGVDLETGDLFAFDLESDSLLTGTRVTPPEAILSFPSNAVALAASVGATDAWVILNGGSVGRIGTDGTFSSLFVLPEPARAMARSPGSNALCVVTESAANTFAVRTISGLGSVLPVGTVTLPGLAPAEVVDAVMSTDAGRDACWVLFRDADGPALELFGFENGGALEICRHGDPLALAAAPFATLAATDPLTVWAVATGGPEPGVRRLRFPDAGCAGTLATDDALSRVVLPDATALVAP